MPLTLAKETMDMNWKDAAASGSSQILLEGDMIVPDSKPDLCLLYTSPSPRDCS